MGQSNTTNVPRQPLRLMRQLCTLRAHEKSRLHTCAQGSSQGSEGGGSMRCFYEVYGGQCCEGAATRYIGLTVCSMNGRTQFSSGHTQNFSCRPGKRPRNSIVFLQATVRTPSDCVGRRCATRDCCTPIPYPFRDRDHLFRQTALHHVVIDAGVHEFQTLA